MSEKKHKVRAVSISGGGIKGLIPAYFMMELEKILQEATGRPDARIVNYLDLMSGTSAGGILSALYLAPTDSSGTLRSAKEVCKAYAELSRGIFRENPSGMPMPDADYSSAKAAEILSTLFKNTELKDLVKPCLITAYEPNRHWMSFFRQQHACLDPAANFLLSDVCLATGALPVYFNPVNIKSFSDQKITAHSFLGALNRENSEILELIEALKTQNIINASGEIQIELKRENREELNLPEKWKPYEKIIFSVLERVKNSSFTFVDGAVFANNPSLCTLVELSNMRFEHLEQNRPKTEETILISLGTGITEQSEVYTGKIDARFTTRFMNMLFGCAESLAHFQCLHAFSAGNVLNQYFYLDPIIKSLPGKNVPNGNFYDVRQDNIKALEDLAASYIEQKQDYLKAIVQSLLKESE
jgi:patatin-like phospholipase/acyl hydrolase